MSPRTEGKTRYRWDGLTNGSLLEHLLLFSTVLYPPQTSHPRPSSPPKHNTPWQPFCSGRKGKDKGNIQRRVRGKTLRNPVTEGIQKSALTTDCPVNQNRSSFRAGGGVVVEKIFPRADVITTKLPPSSPDSMAPQTCWNFLKTLCQKIQLYVSTTVWKQMQP